MTSSTHVLLESLTSHNVSATSHHRPRRHHAPYLDVLTVQSRQYISHQFERDDVDNDHTKLLVEPIHIPDLKHTGIAVPLNTLGHSASAPLFYPNGTKNVHLRQVIQDSLAHVTSTPSLQAPELPTPNTATVTLQPSVSESTASGMHMPSKIQRSTEQFKPKKTTRLHRSIHDRPNDRGTKELLHSVRHNSTKITALVNPHAT
ncbi:hypothetical protein B5M09_009909 [Aphanomyces astaci]|uniref:Uncharacterized protein n=1 Tax=Aphanomyces astaci TaxID=112090 RepID=A0A3R7X903_APHAT|nr:hypothetical protein B5M09_009909 [Aphanomyces astaci]